MKENGQLFRTVGFLKLATIVFKHNSVLRNEKWADSPEKSAKILSALPFPLFLDDADS